jgi:hypothetical protein
MADRLVLWSFAAICLLACASWTQAKTPEDDDGPTVGYKVSFPEFSPDQSMRRECSTCPWEEIATSTPHASPQNAAKDDAAASAWGNGTDDASAWGATQSAASKPPEQNDRPTDAELKMVSDFQTQTGYGSDEDALKWIRAGFSPDEAMQLSMLSPEIAQQWKKAGYTVEQTAQSVTYGIRRPKSLGPMVHACNKNPAESMKVLYQANPYDVKGRCFWFAGKTFQILTRTTALVSNNEEEFLIDFGDRSAPRRSVKGIVKGIGTFEYVTTQGSKQIVPSLKVIVLGEASQ